VDSCGGGSLTYELGESRHMAVGQGPASGLAGRLGHGVTDSARPLASGAGVAARRCLCVVAGLCACGHHGSSSWVFDLRRPRTPLHRVADRTSRRTAREMPGHTTARPDMPPELAWELVIMVIPSEEGVLCTRSREQPRPGLVGDARGTGNAGDHRHGRVSVGPDRPQRAYGAWRVVSPRCAARFRREQLTSPSTRMPRTISSPHDFLPGSQGAPGSLLIFA
jgi:hypothetical protein